METAGARRRRGIPTWWNPWRKTNPIAGPRTDWNLVLERTASGAPDSANAEISELKVPILGDIPFLGRLFRGKNYSSEAESVPDIPPQKDAPKKSGSQHALEVKADGSLTFDATVLTHEALAEKLTASNAGDPSFGVTLRVEKECSLHFRGQGSRCLPRSRHRECHHLGRTR
jgi:hypothetical protein